MPLYYTEISFMFLNSTVCMNEMPKIFQLARRTFSYFSSLHKMNSKLSKKKYSFCGKLWYTYKGLLLLFFHLKQHLKIVLFSHSFIHSFIKKTVGLS